MKHSYKLLLFFSLVTLLACGSKEMKIDEHLKKNSIKFSVNIDDKSADDLVSFGHFSSFDKSFGTAWMEETGLAAYFDMGQLYTYATDNNDNYVYENIISPSIGMNNLSEFAEKHNIAFENLDKEKSSFVGYFYAPHDEYAVILQKEGENHFSGFLSNNFDLYEIIPVYDEENEYQGYQFKLNGDFVGSLQTKSPETFRMSSEFCDATEMIIATIASTLIKTQKL